MSINTKQQANHVARPPPPPVVPILALLSFMVVMSYNIVLDRVLGPDYAGMRGGGPTWFELMPGDRLDSRNSKRRRMEIDRYINKRIAEVFRETWPECVHQRMQAHVCKEFIDQEILSTFTGRDKYIRVIIKGKRSTGDEWYNTVVITMNDMDMAVGTQGDGLISYHFEWEGSGQLATPEQESSIPPVLATETEAGTPTVIEQVLSPTTTTDPEATPSTDDYVPPDEIVSSPTTIDPAVAAAADPASEEYEPLILEEEPILVVGATVEGTVLGTDENPIAGGVVVDPSTPNTPEGDAKLDPLLETITGPASPTATTAPAPTAPSPTGGGEPTTDPGTGGEVTPGGSITIEEAGSRVLPTFDCTGLTGYNCCLMIKLMVRDSDIHDNAIQCQLIYEEGSNKERFWINSRGKKVFIFANHNDIVSKIPEIVGDWPKGVGNFSSWLEDGGDPNRTDWIPEEGI